MNPHQRRNVSILKSNSNSSTTNNNNTSDHNTSTSTTTTNHYDGESQQQEQQDVTTTTTIAATTTTTTAVRTPIHNNNNNSNNWNSNNNQEYLLPTTSSSSSTTTTTSRSTKSQYDNIFSYFTSSSPFKKRMKNGTTTSTTNMMIKSTIGITTATTTAMKYNNSSSNSITNNTSNGNNTTNHHHSNSSSSLNNKNSNVLRTIVLLCLVLYLYFLYQTQHILDRIYQTSITTMTNNNNNNNNNHPSHSTITRRTILLQQQQQHLQNNSQKRIMNKLVSIRGGTFGIGSNQKSTTTSVISNSRGNTNNKVKETKRTSTTTTTKTTSSSSTVKRLPLTVQQYALHRDTYKNIIAQQQEEQQQSDMNAVKNSNNNNNITSTTTTTLDKVQVVDEATELRRRRQIRTLQKQLQQHEQQQNPIIISREPKQYVQYIQNQIIQEKLKQNVIVNTTTNSTTNVVQQYRYIIFNANIGGQGVGNLISGLLAAHLFGIEFNRIVCYNPIYDTDTLQFLRVFEAIDPIAKQHCPMILQQIEKNNLNSNIPSLTVINFQGAADECDIHNIMSSTDYQYVNLVANTYPRWPIVPNYFFFHYYQPTPVLYNALPYTIQPTTVVHLRQPDGSGDTRDGLDNDSLKALEDLVPKNASTFLVTNNVDFYKRFDICCNWSHPVWDVVQHSALSDTWGNVQKAGALNRERQHVQMWVDWYTILMADVVYHTHSDFSISAIHWMNQRTSHSIKRYDHRTKQLLTISESYIVDGETIPLVNRTIHGIPNISNSELRACQGHTRQQTIQREEETIKQQEQVKISVSE